MAWVRSGSLPRYIINELLLCFIIICSHSWILYTPTMMAYYCKGKCIMSSQPKLPKIGLWSILLTSNMWCIWLEPNWLFMEWSEEIYLQKRFWHLQLSMSYRHGSTSPRRSSNQLRHWGNTIAAFHQDRHGLTWYWASSPGLLLHQCEKTWELETGNYFSAN